jgi:AcrR family transcriptional regulator
MAEERSATGAMENSEEGRAAGPREARRKAAILEAARKLFQRYGYRKTTMDEVARDAGITKPTVYSYFKGKKDILISLVEWEGSRVLETGLSSTEEGAGAIEQLVAMFVATDNFLRQDSFLRGIVSRDPDILTPEVIRVAFDFEGKIIDAVARILQRGMDEGVIRITDPRLMAYAIVRLHEAFTFSAFFELEGYDGERINAFFVETMEHILRPS